MNSFVRGAAIAALGAAAQVGAAPLPPDAALEFDWDAFRIGVAEYEDGPTGATVFHFPKPVMAVVDVRGGAPAAVNTDALRLAYDTPFVDAVTIAGGSSYGLSVATGVAQALRERIADAGDWATIATVAGAIIFDLGGRRYNAIVPDEALGRAALAAAVPNRFPLGARGAGRFATQGGFFGQRTYSGQGGGFRTSGPMKVAVFTVVNALGHVVDRDGRVVRCARSPEPCGDIGASIARVLGEAERAAAEAPAGLTANTTITLVVTNQKLPYWALQRLAVQVHHSMGRAIQPFATQNDGDVLFAVSTGEVENAALDYPKLGLLASETAWDAVLASVPPLDARPARVAGASPALDAYAGRYALAPNASAQIVREQDHLVVIAPERDSIYLPAKQRVALAALNETDFVVAGERRDVLRFERDAAGAVTGFTINPGHWPIRAKRID